MRVLVSGVVLDQGMGGVRRHNQELLPRLAELLRADGGELALLAPRGGLAFDPGPAVSVIESSVPSSPPLLRGLVESKQLRTALHEAEQRGAPFGVVHSAHLPSPRLSRSKSAPLRRTHTVHDLRALEPGSSSSLHRLLARPALSQALVGAHRVFTVSEHVRSQLLEQFPLELGRCVVIPNSGDHLEPLPRRPREGAPILHVGHVEPRKNLELLVHALALAPDLPPLLLAGAAKGGEAERLLDFARERGVADRIQLLGAVTDEQLLELYAEAACVAIPSLLEGFGIGVLEAQLAGVPLAVSSAGALPEVAGPKTPRFDPRCAEECVHALRAALEFNSHELMAAREHALRFSWADSARRFYEALVSES